MLTFLVLTVLGATIISGFCSLMEASLFAVPIAHAKYLADSGSKAGRLLYRFKEDLGKPISAILILNTVANTIGAAVAGAMVVAMYGEGAILPFSVLFTLNILCFSEILPKQVGAIHAKTIAVYIAIPLSLLVRLLFPLVWLTQRFSKRIGEHNSLPQVSHEELISLTEIGREEGVIDHLEDSVIRNVIGLDRVLVKNILTPRVVVFRLRKDITIGDVKEQITGWNHTRVPLYAPETPDQLEKYVIQRDLFRALIRGEDAQPIESIARPLSTVPELMRADQLLLRMFEHRESICSVVDEHGGLAGIVTLEDVIEEIVGREIIDEYDLVGDLRSYAQILYRSRKRREIE